MEESSAEKTEFFNPFWHGGAAALLLCAIAISMYLFVAKPATSDAVEVYNELEGARARMRKKEEYLHKLKQRCVELEQGDPQALEEARRQELLLGKKGSFVLSDKMGKKVSGQNAQVNCP